MTMFFTSLATKKNKNKILVVKFFFECLRLSRHEKRKCHFIEWMTENMPLANIILLILITCYVIF